MDKGTADRTVYVVGIWKEEGPWFVKGVFSTPEAADAECTTPRHFYGPWVLDKKGTDGTEVWAGCVYPRAEKS